MHARRSYLRHRTRPHNGNALTLAAIDLLLGEKPVDPGASDWLCTLHKYGITLLIASNTTPGNKCWTALQQAGMDRLFHVALRPYPLGVRKPAKLFYGLVLAAARRPASKVLSVNANLTCDVAGPTEHGMRAASVQPYGLRPGEELPIGTLLISRVRDLPQLLRAS
jgi:FMN phosphatase YigB (HAD superfamily)